MEILNLFVILFGVAVSPSFQYGGYGGYGGYGDYPSYGSYSNNRNYCLDAFHLGMDLCPIISHPLKTPNTTIEEFLKDCALTRYAIDCRMKYTHVYCPSKYNTVEHVKIILESADKQYNDQCMPEIKRRKCPEDMAKKFMKCQENSDNIVVLLPETKSKCKHVEGVSSCIKKAFLELKGCEGNTMIKSMYKISLKILHDKYIDLCGPVIQDIVTSLHNFFTNNMLGIKLP